MPGKAKAPTPTHVTGYAGNDPWAEWSRCMAEATDVRHMPGARVCTVVLSSQGATLASKTETLSRGKVTAVYLSFASQVEGGQP